MSIISNTKPTFLLSLIKLVIGQLLSSTLYFVITMNKSIVRHHSIVLSLLVKFHYALYTVKNNGLF